MLRKILSGIEAEQDRLELTIAVECTADNAFGLDSFN